MTVKAPAILGVRASTRTWPTGGASSAFGRRGSLVVWSKPTVEPRKMGNGRRILPNLSDRITRDAV